MAPLNVAVIGAGPAGIYASDILSKSGLEVNIDLFERLPAPYGLVRYGVAPDHPRIKQIIVALYKILQRGDIRLLGNVEVGRDVTIDDLRDHYDAIIIATGADRDHPLDIPGVDLPESYGAADFVSWYDGNPDYPRTWPLKAREVAVLGVGNVALDVARVLAKHAEDMLKTEVSANVAEGLAENPITDVHVFGRRGPAQVKFTPLELRELGKVPDVDVIVSGVITTWPVQAVYRAVGYYSSPIPGLPFDERAGVVPNVEGRVIEGDTTKDESAPVIPGVYATGWIKRGPVGLIGSTKSDAQQTISHLVEDASEGRLHANTSEVGHEAMVALLESRGVEFTTWEGWELLDAYEQALGEDYGELPGGRGTRERVKVVSRRAMTDISRGARVDPKETDLIGDMGEMGVPSAPERFDDYTGPGRRN